MAIVIPKLSIQSYIYGKTHQIYQKYQMLSKQLQLKLDGNAIALKTDEHSDTSISKPEMDDTGDTHNNRDGTKTVKREYNLFL